jgi:hypothetical protein
LKIYGAGQWLEEKHGAKFHRGWRKLHLALDADSGEIIAHGLTDQDTSDGACDGDPTYIAVRRHSVQASSFHRAQRRWQDRMLSRQTNGIVTSHQFRP